MSQPIQLNMTGLAEYTAWAEGVIARMQDLTPVWEFAHTMFLIEMDEQFRTQGAYLNGQQWQPASPGWVAHKMRVLPPPPPFMTLYYTSRLYLSLTAEGHGEHIFETSPNGCIMGTMVPYAESHQKGTGGHPQRRIIAVRDAFRALVFDAFIAYVLRGTQVQDAVAEGTPSE